MTFLIHKKINEGASQGLDGKKELGVSSQMYSVVHYMSATGDIEDTDM